MSIKYHLFENPPREKNKPSPTLHARPVIKGALKTEELCELLSGKSTFSPGDVEGLLRALSDTLITELSRSHNVYLEGIGTFSVSLSCKPVENRNEIRSASVQVRNIVFRADTQLKKGVRAASLQRAPRPEQKKWDDPARKQRILSYLDQQHSITITEVMRLNHCNHSKAKKDLETLLANGEIRVIGGGRKKLYIR